MKFEILPAIDLRDGKCVRLVRGDYAQETIYHDTPVVVARQWESEGARRLHLVDLDGAREGKPINTDVIGEIARAISVPVQLGGGLRTQEDIQSTLDAGVERCIIGTRAIENEDWARQMFAQFGENLILGIDARDGFVATEGWLETSQISSVEFAQRMESLGCRRMVFTDIARDGTLAGPNLEALEQVAGAVQIPVIASGGVAKSDDVRAIKSISNVEGVIVGKALYEKTANLHEMLNIAAEN